MKTSRILGAAIGAALLVPFALAAGLTSPTDSSIGTEHTIDASGITLPSKPKIKLTYAGPAPGAKGDPKASASKAVVDGDNVTFTVRKAKGAGQFNVTLKGQDDDLGSITIQPPNLQSVGTEEAAPKDSVTLNGLWFGLKKPKVTINGKKGKVTANDDMSITVTLNKKTPGGAGDIVVKTKTGESTLSGQLQVNVPPKPVKGKDLVNGKFGNIRVSAVAGKTGHQVTGTPSIGGGTNIFGQTLSINIGSGSATTRNVTITFPLDFNSPAPGTWSGADVVVVAGEIKGNLANQTIRAYTHSGDTLGDGSSFSISVDSVSGNRVSGSFSGTLVPGENTSGGNVRAGGKFTATLDI